jgi:hypothetical protein
MSARYTRHPEQRVDDSVLCEDILLGDSLNLTFAEHVHGFIVLDGPQRCGKRPKPLPKVYMAFHKSMILFGDIIQMLALSEQAHLRDGAVVLEAVEGQWVRGVLVDGDGRVPQSCG